MGIAQIVVTVCVIRIHADSFFKDGNSLSHLALFDQGIPNIAVCLCASWVDPERLPGPGNGLIVFSNFIKCIPQIDISLLFPGIYFQDFHEMGNGFIHFPLIDQSHSQIQMGRAVVLRRFQRMLKEGYAVSPAGQLVPG